MLDGGTIPEITEPENLGGGEKPLRFSGKAPVRAGQGPVRVLVVAKTTPGYAGGKKIASSEEWRRQEKSSLLD